MSGSNGKPPAAAAAAAAAEAAAKGLPPAPPGCRWMTEGPDGSLIDLQQQQQQQQHQQQEGDLEDLSSDDEAAAAEAAAAATADAADGDGPPKELLLHPQLLESRKRWLLAACEAAGDTVCCLAFNRPQQQQQQQQQQKEQQQQQQQQQQQAPPFLAVGASDDLCRLYDLTKLSPPAAAAAAATAAAAAATAAAAASSPDTAAAEATADVEEQHLSAAVTLRDAGDSVSCVSFSSDGLLLACGSFDGCVRVYSTQAAAAAAAAADTAAAAAGKGVLLQELRGPCEGIAAVSFHPRGYALLAASEDKTAWVWLLPPSWGSPAAAAAAAAAAGGGGGAQGLKPAVVLHVFAAASPLTCCCFSSSGSRCLVGGACGAVSLFAARDGQIVSSFVHPTADSQARAAAAAGPVAPRSSSSSSSSNGMDLDEEAEEQGAVCLAVDTPHSCCLVGYEDGYILGINEETGKAFVSVRGHAAAVECLLPVHPKHRLYASSWGPQGPSATLLIFSAGLDGKIRLWNLSKKTVKLTFDCTYTPVPVGPSASSSSSSSSGSSGSNSSGSSSSSSSSSEGEGVVRLLLHPEQPLLLAGTSFGLMRAFNCSSSSSSNSSKGSSECLDIWTAHPSPVMDLQQISSSSSSSSRDWIVASGDSEGGVYIWALDPRALLQGPPKGL
ncbi:WD domain, G-beta repeat-containing protein, putative [Eimeria acervulina]|uniref:WD domain, G-beta repeat-containing protein, putative n=1 Tax=Eimeria acervulina TaxID=5801 RepID=U6GG99_EIMAC|nr:WD domain, G-beta repeat-containing protein, putative [Eimeria acervulina]CDI78328.1 WD domain, G-beta repeat-containing protein, putative [Eimeria acervulina]